MSGSSPPSGDIWPNDDIEGSQSAAFASTLFWCNVLCLLAGRERETMKSILCFLIGAAMVLGLSHVPSASLAQTDNAEQVTGQDSQSDIDPMQEEFEILPDGEEPPAEWEEALPEDDGAMQDDSTGDDPADEGPVIVVPEL
jgi:hypothetical protein